MQRVDSHVALKSMTVSSKDRLAAFLFDTGFLTGEVAQVEDTGATHGTALVDVYLLDERAGEGEDTLHSDAVRDLADSKGLSSSASTALQHNALEVLDSFFVTFFNRYDGRAQWRKGRAQGRRFLDDQEKRR